MDARINLTDENFQSQLSVKCDLLIRIRERNIAFAVLSRDTKEIKALVDQDFENSALTDNLRSLIEKYSILKFYYRKVRVSVETSKYTFVPDELYAGSQLPEYSKFIRPSLHSDVLTESIGTARLKNVFAADHALQKFLQASFGDPLICSQAQPFIEGIFRLKEQNSGPSLFLNFSQNSFEAAVVLNEKLAFYNMFPFEDTGEFNYFLLLIISQFSLGKSSSNVFFSGQLSENDELAQCIGKYFDNPAPVPFNLPMPEKFHNVTAAAYFSLLSLELCE